MPTITRGLSVDFTEPGNKEGDSPNEQVDADGLKGTRIFDVAWTDRNQAFLDLLGYSYIDKSNPVAWRLRRHLPDFHPEFPLTIAVSIATKGLGSRGQRLVNGKRINTYEKARLTVQYDSPPYDVLEDNAIATEFDRFRTYEVQPAAEYLSPPSTGTLKWSQGPHAGTPFPGNVGIIFGTVDFHWRWLQVPLEGLPFQTMLGTVGRVNLDTFAGCDPGTLLLTAHPFERKNNPAQTRTVNIEYVARYNARTHNVFYDWEAKNWYQASADGVYYPPGSVPDGKLLYDERPFADLFDVNAA